MTSKDHYRLYCADEILYPLNEFLLDLIMIHNPSSVFEFGCGVAKHLTWLNARGINTLGCDMSVNNVADIAKSKWDQKVIFADESVLPFLNSFDIVFTCSVLCHIPDIGFIVDQFKQMATDRIIVAETNELSGDYHYPHDYEAHGFTKLDYEVVSPGNQLTYNIWIWEAAQAQSE